MATDGRSVLVAPILAGVLLAIGAKALLERLLLVKFRRDVAALGAGDYSPMLSAYADDAVLRFNAGDHRWSGEHRGKAALERFFANFVGAGLHGEVGELHVAGPPWRMTLLVRFDDRAEDADGTEVYRNRAAIVARTRWGRVVEQEDFYEDTKRIEALEANLRSRGIDPAP